MVVPQKDGMEIQQPGIVRVKGHKTKASLKNSANHTWRKNDASEYPHVDLNKTPLNIDIMGAKNTAELLESFDNCISKVKRVTKSSILCIEFLITADFDAFYENGGPLQVQQLARDAKSLLVEFFGEENIIGFNIQLDELTPHIVVYVVPVVYRPARKVYVTKRAGTYYDGSARYIEIPKKKEAYVSLSATHFYDLFGGKQGLQTLFAKFVFEPNGLSRGFYFSQQRHFDAKTHKLALKESYSLAKSNLSVTPSQIKEMGNLLFMSKDKIAEKVNKIIMENGKEIIAMSAEYENEREKRESLNKTLTVTQEYMINLEQEHEAALSKLKVYESLSEENKSLSNDYVLKLRKMEEDDIQKELDRKESERISVIQAVNDISIDSFVFFESETRIKLWFFMRENPELEEKFVEFHMTGFFKSENGELSESGKVYKKKLMASDEGMTDVNHKKWLNDFKPDSDGNPPFER